MRVAIHAAAVNRGFIGLPLGWVEVGEVGVGLQCPDEAGFPFL